MAYLVNTTTTTQTTLQITTLNHQLSQVQTSIIATENYNIRKHAPLILMCQSQSVMSSTSERAQSTPE
jgi:hypothetical protein